ncbi:MAG: hypothetical protein LBJ40_01590 [Delftia acidovorans]|jgi:hypothetical protein|uniref:DUF3488 domain-containing protein n=1 Tax=Delftia acidovorans TaxID=80866 RepID=UPI00281CADFC|nr:hypothetical protein [Delftia acidovorans]MDR3014115.1 hypothetical protein [Delftia acidovorans]
MHSIRQSFHKGIHRMSFLLLTILLCGFLLPAGATDTTFHDQGVLEDIHFDAAKQQLIAKGWSASGRSHAFPTQASIFLDDHLVYQGRLNALSYPRPDVVAATGNPNWANAGFHIRAPLDPDFASGTYTVRMEIMTTDGRRFALTTMDKARQITLNQPARAGLLPRAGALVAFCLPALLLLLSLSGWQSRLRIGVRAFGAATAAAFITLVAGGWTGSSVSLLFQNDELVTHDENAWLGAPQIIRSDEWQVITAMAISQYHAAAPGHLLKSFENTSTVFSSAGHNMNTVGMSGVPVSNLSALAKPATWGFFILDLRRALAWYWWFPYFAGFAACLWVLVRIAQLRWQPAAVLALGVSASPMSVGWSGWPVYILFFALLAFGMFLTAWTRQSIRQVLPRALVAGWALAGFALTLYPAWLVVVASLLGPLAIVWLYMHRGDWRWNWQQALLVVVMALVPALLLYAWWLHAADAVSSIAATVYPGRRMETGGYMDPWYLARGLFGPDQMFHITDMLVPSDAGSHIFLAIPLALLFAWQQKQDMRCSTPRQLDLTGCLCLVFIGWTLYFSYQGIPAWLAQATQWSKVPVYRTDIGLLLAQTWLLASVLRKQWPTQASEIIPTIPERQRQLSALAVTGAAACAWLAYFTYSTLPVAISETISPGVAVITATAFAVLALLLANRQFVAAMAIYMVWMLGTALPFNPLLQAPLHVEPGPKLQQLDADATSRQARWVVLDNHQQAMALAASGIRISSGIFYHPPLAFWERLDPGRKYFGIYNRYQHLTIEGADLQGTDFEPVLHSLDHVLLRVDTRSFDFSKIAATHIAAPRRHEQGLNQNPHLRHLKSEGSWSFYRTID